MTTLKELYQLAKKDITNSQASAYLYVINDTTNKMYITIKSIKNVYEIKHKKINTEKLKLKPLINQIVQTFENDMEKEISMSVEVQENITLPADKDIILLVLTELVKNYIQFNSRLNGKIYLSSKCTKNHLFQTRSPYDIISFYSNINESS